MKELTASSREPQLNPPQKAPHRFVKFNKIVGKLILILAIIGVVLLKSPDRHPEYREKKAAKRELGAFIDTSFQLVQKYTKQKFPDVPTRFYRELEHVNSAYIKMNIFNEVEEKIDSIYAIPKISDNDIKTEMKILGVTAVTKISIEIRDCLKEGLLDEGYATQEELAQIFTEWP